jgi:hypothetical protein
MPWRRETVSKEGRARQAAAMRAYWAEKRAEWSAAISQGMAESRAGRFNGLVDPRKLGRPRALTPEEEQKALAALEAGSKIRVVARQFRVSPQTIWRLKRSQFTARP